MSKVEEDRRMLLVLRQAGLTQKEVASSLNRSERWVRKWEKRVAAEGQAGLHEKSRAPHRVHQKTSLDVVKAILKAREDLEKGGVPTQPLKYIGGAAIRTVLKARDCHPLPSIATIERIIRAAGKTRPKAKNELVEIHYPHLKPKEAHVLIQVDIVPHYLKGGAKIACFNALDVCSKYPTGMAKAQRRAVDAEAFLIDAWQTLGIPQYTQVDNEGCFSGGTTHPRVLGKVVRLALEVGTELIFSPTYHPQSNGHVERFHQDYNRHVWEDTYLSDLSAVNAQADTFFQHYRESGHHSRLNGRTPREVHAVESARYLDADFAVAQSRRPLYSGKVHFMRRVSPDQSIRVLNVDWPVTASPDSGVWATLHLASNQCRLNIYDQPPDQADRICLNSHPFSINEEVIDTEDDHIDSIPPNQLRCGYHIPPLSQRDRSERSLADYFFDSGQQWFLQKLFPKLRMTLEWTSHWIE